MRKIGLDEFYICEFTTIDKDISDVTQREIGTREVTEVKRYSIQQTVTEIGVVEITSDEVTIEKLDVVEEETTQVFTDDVFVLNGQTFSGTTKLEFVDQFFSCHSSSFHMYSHFLPVCDR